MSLWKQLFLSAAVIVIAGGLAAGLSPGVAAFLAGHGLAAPLRLVGLAPADAPAQGGPDAAPQGARGAPGDAGARRGPPRKALVVVQPAGTAVINDRITALGTGEALQSVIVLPKANGTLTEVSVQSGAQVAAGQVIARLDSAAQQIARDKAKLAADDAQRTLARNKVLVASDAVPANQMQALELAAGMADLAIRAADQELADRVITAPIAGVAGIVKVSPGNAVTPQTEIVSIEDSSSLRVNFWLPERLSGQIRPGAAATLVPVARPEATLAATVASIDNQIDPASGTFQVQALIANPDGSLQPGMAFTVAMQFTGQSYVTVNPLSVQWGSDGAYVWRVTDSKVERVGIRVVQRNTETVLVAGALAPGDAIVTEGLDGLKDGAEVQVQGAPEAAPGTEASAPAQGGAPRVAADAAAATPGKAQGGPPAPVGN